MVWLKTANLAESTLLADITNTATELSVQAGHGTKFPADNFEVVVTLPDHSNWEVMLCTSRSTDTLTVTRYAGAVAHAAGELVELRVTKKYITELQDAQDTHAGLTTGVHGVGELYIAKSATDGLDMAAHASRHQFGGADALNIKDSIFQATPRIYKAWWDTTGFIQNKDAEATIALNSAQLGMMYLGTGATSGRKASVYAAVALYHANNDNYRTRFATKISTWAASQASQTIYVGCYLTPTAPTATQNHIGFVIEGSALYATNADGTTETKSAKILNTIQWGIYNLYYVYKGTNFIKFYVNGSLAATHTTNIPNNQYLKPLYYVINSAAVDKQIYCWPLVIYQGAI